MENEIKNEVKNKPLSLMIEDTKKNMIENIKNSKLPFYILEYLLKDLYLECKEAAAFQTQQEAVDFENASKTNNKIN